MYTHARARTHNSFTTSPCFCEYTFLCNFNARFKRDLNYINLNGLSCTNLLAGGSLKPEQAAHNLCRNVKMMMMKFVTKRFSNKASDLVVSSICLRLSLIHISLEGIVIMLS